MWICPVCQKENIDNAHLCLSCMTGKLCNNCSSPFTGDVCQQCGKDTDTPIWMTEKEYEQYISSITAILEEPVVEESVVEEPEAEEPEAEESFEEAEEPEAENGESIPKGQFDTVAPPDLEAYMAAEQDVKNATAETKK